MQIFKVSLQGYTFVFAETNEQAEQLVIDQIGNILKGDNIEESSSPWKYR